MTVLGETTLSASSAPLSLLIIFPQVIHITAGAQYAIVVNYEGAPPPGGGQGQGEWIGEGGDQYTRGTLYASFPDDVSWFQFEGADVHFQTYVNVVPVASLNVNSELSGRVKPGTSTFNPQPVSDGPAGAFSFTAEFCNIGDEHLIFLKSVTAVLTGGSILLSRDSGTPPGVGSELTFAANREYLDLTLDGGECVDVPYVIGLARRAPFEFLVDVLGVITDDNR